MDGVIVLAKVDDEIEVARLRIEGAGGGRAKDVQLPDVVLAAERDNFIFPLRNQGNHERLPLS